MRNETGTATIPVEELKKYKALLDEGAITEEEFQRIKAEFLENDGKVNTQPAKAPAAKFDLKKNLKFIIPAAAVLMAIIVLVIVSIARNNPETVAKRFSRNNYINTKTADTLLAYDWKDYLIGVYGSEEECFSSYSRRCYSTITSWSEYYKVIDDSYKQGYNNIYGKYTISAEVIDSWDMEIETLYRKYSSFIGELEYWTAFDFDQVDEAKGITVQVDISGKEGSKQYCDTLYMVKYNGKWSVLTGTTTK